MPQNHHILFPFLKYLQVPYTNHYLNKLTAGMPNSNTLLGVSTILKERYKVECMSLLIEKNDLFKLDTPFIVPFDLPSNPLVMVVDVHPDKVSYIYKNEKITEPLKYFFAKWNGTVLLAEAEEDSQEEKYWQNFRIETLKKLRLPAIIFFSVALLAYFGKTSLFDLSLKGWTPIALLFSYFFGLVISSLLLSQSIDKSNSFVAKVCNSGNKKGCSKILEGEASMIFDVISWSEIGFLYFIGSVLTFLFVKESIGVLFIMSVLALPYTFWSIYYQWKIARQWCPFCVTVQGMLWLIFILHVLNIQNLSLVFNLNQIINTAACFLAPALALWLIVPYAKSHHELGTLKTEYKSFKFSEPIIESALKLNPPVDTSDAGSIILGHPESKMAIIVVTDLTCPYCIEAHQYLKELLRFSKEKVSIQIVFSIPKHLPGAGKHYNSAVDEKNILVKHFVSIYKSYDPEKAETVFHEWYEKGRNNYKKFLKQYPVEKDIPGVDQEIENHINWCNKVGISGTPTFFINQYRLPQWYRANDIKDIVDTLTI